MEFTLILIVLVVALIAWFAKGGVQKRQRLLNEAYDAFRLGEGEKGEKLLTELEPLLITARDCHKAAKALYKARTFEHALRLAQKGLAHKPNHKPLQRVVLLCRTSTIDVDAVPDIRAWLHDNPNDDEVIMKTSHMMLELRRLEEGISILAPYVQSNPDMRAPHSILGRFYFYDGQLDKAREHLLAAQQLREVARKLDERPTGYDITGHAHLTPEDKLMTLDDQRLLEQISDGTARSPIAIYDDAEDTSQDAQENAPHPAPKQAEPNPLKLSYLPALESEEWAEQTPAEETVQAVRATSPKTQDH